MHRFIIPINIVVGYQKSPISSAKSSLFHSSPLYATLLLLNAFVTLICCMHYKLPFHLLTLISD